MAHGSEVPEMTVGRAVLVEWMRRYLAGLLDPFITLLEAHKLMYFMQEAGEPLQLRFTQALFAAAWRCPEQSGCPLPAIEAATAATNEPGSPQALLVGWGER